LCRSRDMDDVTRREQEVREREEDTSEVPILDVVPDQPSSTTQTEGKKIQPIQDDRQEVLGDGSISTGRNEDRKAPSSANISDRERSTMEENIRVHTSLDTDELANLPDALTPTLQSAMIDCSPGNNNVESQPSPGERQRPIRNAGRPTRYRDAAFDTQFQPMPRRHRRIQRRDTTGNYVTNKGQWRRLGRGDKQRYIIPMKNKEATSVINRQDARQSPAKPVVSRLPKTNRHRYPRRHEERMKSVVMPHPPESLQGATSPAKVSKTRHRHRPRRKKRKKHDLYPAAVSADLSNVPASSNNRQETVSKN